MSAATKNGMERSPTPLRPSLLSFILGPYQTEEIFNEGSDKVLTLSAFSDSGSYVAYLHRHWNPQAFITSTHASPIINMTSKGLLGRVPFWQAVVFFCFLSRNLFVIRVVTAPLATPGSTFIPYVTLNLMGSTDFFAGSA